MVQLKAGIPAPHGGMHNTDDHHKYTCNFIGAIEPF